MFRYALLTLLLLPAQAQDSAEQRPAAEPYPRTPPIEGYETSGPSGGGALDRNASRSGRLTSADDSVRMTFSARAGELSLFELGCWGYSRGWQSTAVVRVLNAAGEIVLERVRPGGTVHHTLVEFVAPAAGDYVLELSTRIAGFRFALVRHSNFVPKPLARDVGEASEVFSWVHSSDDTAVFSVPVSAGQPLALKATLLRSFAQRPYQLRRSQQPLAVLAGTPLRDPSERTMGEGMQRGMRRAADVGESFPDLALEVRAEDRVLSEGHHYALFEPTKDGHLQVSIVCRGRSEGALVQLSVERNPECVPVAVHVGDYEGEPAAGVTVTFLRAPDMDRVASATVGREGQLDFKLPPGSYLVLLRRGKGRLARVEAFVGEEPELNFVYSH